MIVPEFYTIRKTAKYFLLMASLAKWPVSSCELRALGVHPDLGTDPLHNPAKLIPLGLAC